MVNLTAINKTKKAYTGTDHELLFLGIFQENIFRVTKQTLNNETSISFILLCFGMNPQQGIPKS